MRIKRNKKKTIVCIAIFSLFLLTIIVTIFFVSGKSVAPKASKKQVQKTTKKESLPTPSFNKTLYSTVDPSSIWVIVNKPHALNPKAFQPTDLVGVGGQMVSSKAAPNLQVLITDAKAHGVTLRVISGYRSYSYQTSLYNSYVAKDGQALADTYSARPGHSEHQTGFATDIGGVHGCDVEQCFGTTPEGQWLAQNAHKYGFILRYTESNQPITGYQSEPWHIRYIGVDLVNELKKQNITTLEQFFGVSGGLTYID